MPALTSMAVDHLTVRPLAADTWPAFADLVVRHNGVFGGCWCTFFHSLSRDKDRTYESNRDLKCHLVEEGRAHAALIFDGDRRRGWDRLGAATTAEVLALAGLLPAELESRISEIRKVRNAWIHGGGPVGYRIATEAVTLAAALLDQYMGLTFKVAPTVPVVGLGV